MKNTDLSKRAQTPSTWPIMLLRARSESTNFVVPIPQLGELRAREGQIRNRYYAIIFWICKSMSLFVLLKDIPDLNELEADPSSNELNTKGVKRRISDLDLRALEAALKLKEGIGGNVVTITVGDEDSKTVLLQALAMGADESILVQIPELVEVDCLITSKIIEGCIRKIGEYKIIIAGEMSLDGLNSQVGPRVAELLDVPQITYVKNIEASETMVSAIRDLEDGEEVVEADFPVLLTVLREINEPRIPSLMNIMRARKKPMLNWSLGELGLSKDELSDLSKVTTTSIEVPTVERKNIIIEADSVEEMVKILIQHLREEGIIGE